ncbi:MAG: hypothetical protein IKJ75_01280 [Clostridia bacterium]|nr:hypothetical protein [Clostridia bacterium]
MKKINVFVTILAGVILCLLLNFTACEDNSGVVIDPNATNSANQSDAYFFKAGDAEICLYMPLSEVESMLGKPSLSYENPSCGYVGMDLFYQYNGFELTINEIDNNKVVTDIFVLDDTVSIPQGLKIGDSQDKIPQLMGDNYTKDGNAYNFVDGNTLLQIMVSDGAIKSIEYKPAN